MNRITNFHERDPPPRWRSDAGLEAVEYALIAAILLTALFLAVPQFVNQFAPAYNAIMNSLTTAMGN